MGSKRIRIKVGDVFEAYINDGKEKVFFQYIGRDLLALNSDVIKVFKDIHKREHNFYEKDLLGEVYFYSHTHIGVGVRDGLWTRVAHINIDNNAEKPCFRASEDEGNLKIQRSVKWSIWRMNDENLTKVGELPEKYHQCEPGGLYPPFAIINRIEKGDYGFRIPDF